MPIRHPQALIDRADLRAQFQIARAVFAAATLTALIIGGYGMLIEATSALPALMAEAAARNAG